MRELKFRAWHPATNEMIVFDNEKASNDKFIAMQICALLANKHPQGEGLMMQYAGLKDKNGVEIYEGDILLNDYSPPRHVIFEEGAFRFKDGGNQCNQSLVPFTCSKLIVVGNIHENPELIEDVNE